ncbi:MULTISPECIES: hypothetical protein [unclassified Amycolatopsis]|uniref:hypothetical protein n=1 Tax=unclassified Amycolatopsis TaxID=2618356 RepID=UPI001C696D15|nr:hypothetical protein [Amycolatopsis sp. DSM 110486]QYN23976.1 hypothetical protein K1T34_16930 [Amycolatopsis sp. DSM 110486]
MTRGEQLCEVINDLLHILRTGEHDTSWSSYRSVDDAIVELEQLKERIRQRDPKAEQRLRELFLPTGALEEIAVSSGWSGTWVGLTKKIDPQ